MLQKISTQVADCYERADESRARAAAAADENDKTEYLNIERRWIMRARSYELSERIMGVPRVTCAHCGRKMRLTHIEPVVKGGHVTNTSAFACKCGFTCRQVADR
jgi:hypothetical protein